MVIKPSILGGNHEVGDSFVCWAHPRSRRVRYERRAAFDRCLRDRCGPSRLGPQARPRVHRLDWEDQLGKRRRLHVDFVDEGAGSSEESAELEAWVRFPGIVSDPPRSGGRVLKFSTPAFLFV